MSRHPRFTVCICTFNDGDTIREFFESVAAQIDDRFEVVVVDGGSDDGTREYLRDRAETLPSRLRMIDQRGRGLGRARQQCVDAAKGTYLLEQVDADMIYADCFDPLLSFYTDRVDEEGPFQLLTRGLRITPQALHEELGGWRPYPNGFQENELTRRFFGADALRLMDVRTARHVDVEHDFSTAFRRYLYNYREKFRSGLSPRYAIWHLYESNLPVYRKLLDVGTIAATYLWAQRYDRVETFEPDDSLAFEIDRRLYEGCADGTYDDIRLTPPPEVREACFDESDPDKKYSYTDTTL